MESWESSVAIKKKRPDVEPTSGDATSPLDGSYGGISHHNTSYKSFAR